jgi:capsular exopolysaccharide synthesis family protein
MNEASPLQRYAVPIRRWWWVVVGAVVLGMVVAWVTTPSAAVEPTAEEIADPSTTFRATHILMRNETATDIPNFDLVLLLARQGDLTGRVLERMEGRVETADIDEVVLEADPEIGTISVTATQPTPTLASDLATTYAQEIMRVVDERAQRAIEERIERTIQRRESLDERIRDLEGEVAALPEDDVDRRLVEAEVNDLVNEFATAQTEERVLREERAALEPQFETLQEPAPVSTDSLSDGLLSLPSSPLPRLAMAGFLGLLVGTLIVLGIDYLDTRVRTRRDAEDAFGLPVITQLPHRGRRDRGPDPLPVVSDPSGPTAEAFRALRLSIQLAPTWRLSGRAPTRNGAAGTVMPDEEGRDPRSIVVTSSLTGEGKSTLVANLAASYAEGDQTVLVIDCDFRRPAVGGLLGVGPGPGLRDLGPGQSASLSELVVPTSVERVSLVRAGSAGIPPSWFLAMSEAVVEQSLKLADIVLFDTGPLELTTEASTLIPSIDTVLLVARANRLSRGEAWETVERLSRLSARVAGVVLVGAETTRRYGYYQADEGPGARGSGRSTAAPDSATPGGAAGNGRKGASRSQALRP